MQAKRDWQEIFKVVKCRDLQPRLLCPAKISFRIEGLILKKKNVKSFLDKEKVKELNVTKPLLYEILKRLI